MIIIYMFRGLISHFLKSLKVKMTHYRIILLLYTIVLSCNGKENNTSIKESNPIQLQQEDIEKTYYSSNDTVYFKFSDNYQKFKNKRADDSIEDDKSWKKVDSAVLKKGHQNLIMRLIKKIEVNEFKVENYDIFFDGNQIKLDQLWSKGTLREISKWKSNEAKAFGQWFFYDSNGSLYQIGNYKDGKKNGVWYTMYEDGSTSKLEFYKNDEKINYTGKYTIYDEESRPWIVGHQVLPTNFALGDQTSYDYASNVYYNSKYELLGSKLKETVNKYDLKTNELLNSYIEEEILEYEFFKKLLSEGVTNLPFGNWPKELPHCEEPFLIAKEYCNIQNQELINARVEYLINDTLKTSLPFEFKGLDFGLKPNSTDWTYSDSFYTKDGHGQMPICLYVKDSIEQSFIPYGREYNKSEFLVEIFNFKRNDNVTIVGFAIQSYCNKNKSLVVKVNSYNKEGNIIDELTLDRRFFFKQYGYNFYSDIKIDKNYTISLKRSKIEFLKYNPNNIEEDEHGNLVDNKGYHIDFDYNESIDSLFYNISKSGMFLKEASL